MNTVFNAKAVVLPTAASARGGAATLTAFLSAPLLLRPLFGARLLFSSILGLILRTILSLCR